jgi:hypothetical protein
MLDFSSHTSVVGEGPCHGYGKNEDCSRTEGNIGSGGLSLSEDEIFFGHGDPTFSRIKVQGYLADDQTPYLI